MYVLRRLVSRAETVVGVVGAGHLPGIKACWEKEIDIEEIMSEPVPRRRLRWGRIALFAAGGVLLSSVCLRYTRRLR